jgi:hypothetical protein
MRMSLKFDASISLDDAPAWRIGTVFNTVRMAVWTLILAMSVMLVLLASNKSSDAWKWVLGSAGISTIISGSS